MRWMMGPSTRYTKRRDESVDSPKTWGSVGLHIPQCQAPFGPSHLRWPHVTHPTSSQLPPPFAALSSRPWVDDLRRYAVMLRKPANCRRKTSTEGTRSLSLKETSGAEETGNLPEENLNLVSRAFHDLLPSSSRGLASLLCRSTASRAGAPRVPEHLRLYVAGRSAGAPPVPKHLRLHVAGRSVGAPLRVPEHLRLHVAGRSAGAPLRVPEHHFACRSTFGCTSPVAVSEHHFACRSTFSYTSPAAVPEHRFACRSTFGCTSPVAVPEHRFACRSTFGCTSPVAVPEHRFACQSTFSGTSPVAVPEHLVCRSTFGCTSPVAVPEHRFACRSTFGGTSPVAVPEHLACRSTFGCTSPIAVPEHLVCRSPLRRYVAGRVYDALSRAVARSAVRRR